LVKTPNQRTIAGEHHRGQDRKAELEAEDDLAQHEQLTGAAFAVQRRHRDGRHDRQRARREPPDDRRHALIEERDQLAGQNDRLRHLLRQLQRMQFGRRSEKLDPDQFNLALEDLEQAIAANEAEQENADPALRKALSDKRRADRSRLPDHLPRVEIVIPPEDTACPCCGGAMHVIGEDRSQRLDVIPAQYRVLVTRRPKDACRACQEAVLQAPAPARLIEGGLPTERLVAHVVVAKYADHCPLSRQAQILGRLCRGRDQTPMAAAA
jgi:transposase